MQNYKELMAKMEEKLVNFTVAELKEQALKMFHDDSDEASDVLQALLITLEKRLPTAEYVAFCDGAFEYIISPKLDNLTASV